ncbi:DMT family transporter [Leptothrix sp. BB-4]
MLRRFQSPTLMMIGAAFLFASMGVAVKIASAWYPSTEIVMYRGIVGLLLMLLLMRRQRTSWRTPVPAMHFWRGLSGVSSLLMWFYAITGLPLATAMTLNYMSSVWMALFLIGGSVMLGGSRIDGRLVLTALAGFCGVAAILRPTIEASQLWHGVIGLLSGMLSAMAYLQVSALGRAGEPETRVVFYFSLGGLLAGAVLTAFNDGFHGHTPKGALALLAVGLFATSAQLLMTRAYAIGKPLVNASLQYLGIAFAFVYSVLLFGDPVHLLSVAGMLLVVAAGIAAARLRHDRQKTDRGPDTLVPEIE